MNNYIFSKKENWLSKVHLISTSTISTEFDDLNKSNTVADKNKVNVETSDGNLLMKIPIGSVEINNLNEITYSNYLNNRNNF